MLSSETGFGPLTRKSVDEHRLHPLLFSETCVRVTNTSSIVTTILIDKTKQFI